MSPNEAQYIRVSLETLLSLAATTFIPAVGAAWVLLRYMVFMPLTDVKDEISSLGKWVQTLATKQTKIEHEHAAKITVQEQRMQSLESEVKELRKGCMYNCPKN